MTTILYDDRETVIENASAQAEELWLPLEALEAATGWHVSPEGMCRGKMCVPVPRGAGWLDEPKARRRFAADCHPERSPTDSAA